ncbi:MAG: LamG domain-containing protein [Candidatus Poribacteria bacterium]|nr:LamG domain-containing protein [Candidatus Poribacteria bacterium]
MSLSKIVCLIFFLSGIISLTANAGLMGYWSFDEADEANDLSGNGHDGVIRGNPKVIAGKFGEALEFNGSTDYVEIPDAPAISELKALSMSAWINPTKLGSWVAVAEKGIHLNWSYGFFIEPDGTLSFYVSTGPGNNLVCCVGNFALEIGKWYHIFGSYDGKSVKAYVDGKLEGEMPGNDAVHITEGLPFTISSRNGQNHYGGAVDEVAFWDEAIAVEDAMDPLLVKPGRKLTTTWGAIKTRR